MDRHDAEARILSRGWLAHQPEPFRTAVFKRARLVSLPVGQYLFHAGDDLGGVFGIVDGGIGIHIPQPGGSVLLAHVARCGVWFGHGPLITRRARTLTFSALEATLAFQLPLKTLDELIAAKPEWSRHMFAVSEFAMDVAIATVATLQIRSPERRIAATLLRIAPTSEGAEPGQPLIAQVSQSQLGEMANAARDVVNRTLKKFEQKGWLSVAYGKVSIHRPDCLSALVAAERS